MPTLSVEVVALAVGDIPAGFPCREGAFQACARVFEVSPRPRFDDIADPADFTVLLP